MKLILLAFLVAAAAGLPVPEDSGPVDVIVNGVPEGEALDIGHLLDIKVQEHVDGEVVAAANLLHPYTAVGIAEAAAAAAAEAVQPAPEVPAPQPVILPAPISPVVQPEPVVLPAPVFPAVQPEIAILPDAPVSPVVLPAPVSPVVQPEPVVLPAPQSPVVQPEPVVLHAPASPAVQPEPVVLPAPVFPVVQPEPVVLPSPELPVVQPEPVLLPQPISPVVVPEATNPEVAEPLPVPAPQGQVFNDGNVQVVVNPTGDAGLLSTLQSWFNMIVNYVSSGGTTTASMQVV